MAWKILIPLTPSTTTAFVQEAPIFRHLGSLSLSQTPALSVVALLE
jgi:hypothetical protein